MYEFTELEAVKPLRQNAYPAKDQEGNPVEETLPRINYWGFKKGYYFAPKASYSVKDPVLEFKEMVRAFHAEGMEVILQFYFPKEINREMSDPILGVRVPYRRRASDGRTDSGGNSGS